MEETVFPPSPCWCLPNILSTREDGSVSYGSKTTIVILNCKNKSKEMTLIRNAHTERIAAVAFAPSNCSKSLQNTVVSGAGDGFVKLWKIDTLAVMMGHKSHQEPPGDIGKIASLDWSVANPCHIVSVAENNTLVLWDVVSNTTLKFSLQKGLGAAVVSCCPHSEKMVAVGGKTGQVHILSLTGSGHILLKLRGHDNRILSLSWCPLPLNVFTPGDVEEEFLLASACQNKEVFVWRAGTDGKCEAKYQIPTNPLSKKANQYYGKMGSSFTYTAVLWLEPYKIYSSSNFGELIYFDIRSFVSEGMSEGRGRQKTSMSCFRLGHHCHSKGLFAIAGLPGRQEVVVYGDVDVKSKLKLVKELNFGISGRAGGVCGGEGAWEALARESSLVWTAGQDKEVVACEVRASGVEVVATYHTFNNFVYCAVASPHDPNKIAIGAGDGMIRLWNLTDCAELRTFWQKIRDRVMSLAWHPSKDGLLAYGTSEGRVGLVPTNSTKLPTVFKPSHPQPIYSLSWGPPFHSADHPPGPDFDLYSIGNNILSVYTPSKLTDSPLNLSELIPFPCRKQTDVCWKPDHSVMAVGNEDGSVCLVDPSDFSIACTVQVYKKFIESIAWHPMSTSVDSGLSPCEGYLASGSTDNRCEVRVFEWRRERRGAELVATLRGHFGHIASVAWSPHVSGRLVSTSADGSVQVWDVLQQTPVANFVPSGMGLFSMFSPIDSDIVLTGCKTEALHVWRVSGQTRTAPSQVGKVKKQVKENLSKVLAVDAAGGGGGGGGEGGMGAVAEGVVGGKGAREVRMFSKAWKTEAEEGLELCYGLLKSEGGRGGDYSLSFLGSEEDFRESVSAEEESLRNRTEMYELALWKGGMKEVVEERTRSGQLNEFLVSVAPSVSPRAWQEACLSYSRTLAERKMHRRAASYLIVCHKIYEAIRLLADANLYLEALCIARSRLPPSDPVFGSVLREYAQWLFKTGSFLRACQCYIYLEDYLEVARVCGKKNHAEYLSLAALAAKKCGSDLEPLEATNAIFKSFETGRFDLAERICADHDSFRHLGLFRCVYHTIHHLDVGALALEKDILSHIKESFECGNVLFPPCVPKLFHKHCLYSSKHQVLRVLTEELSFAACATEEEEVLSHLIKALSTCSRHSQTPAEQEQLLYKLCVWLSPRGFLTAGDVFSGGSSPLVRSLRAFLCAALVKHLSQNTEEVPQRLELLKELKDDLLERSSFEYFRNLMEIEMCEKRLVTNQSKLSRRGLAGVGEGSGACGTANGGEAVGEGFPEGEGDEVGAERGENGEGLSEVVPGEVETREEDSEDGGLKREVQKDMELLDRLKLETESFEKSRIIAPNPIPFHFMLKKLCLGFPENETAKLLLEDLNKNEQI